MFVANIMRAFGEGNDDPALNRARYIAVSRQIPVMYCIIGVSLIAVAYTHYGVAADYLSLYIPVALVAMLLYRAINLLRSDISSLTDEDIAHRMVAAVKRTTMIAVTFAALEIALFHQGNAYTQMHVAFFATITVLGCIACMMHLRLQSTILALFVALPPVVLLILSDVVVFKAIAVNTFVVVGTMLFMCFRYAGDFAELIAKQQQLQEQRSRLRALNRQNRWLADHDSLTNLPNRRHFFSRLAESIGGDAVEARPRIVGILDLDGFKAVNDVLGHLAGDQLLADTANRLRDVLNQDAFLARLGGDEFGVIFSASTDAEGAVKKSHQMCEALLAAFDVKGSSVHIAATVGLASFPSAGRTGEEVYERADYALCYAKQHSRGTVVLFSEEHETIIREVSQITHQLREAELDEELSVVYQPIIDSHAGELIAFEALARWDSPVLGRISPDTFIRTAEQAGLIGQLTTILFRKALAVAQTWPKHIGLSFNLSPYDLNSFETMARLIQAVGDSTIHPSRITFEITESALVQDIGRATESLEVLRNMGASIALDDFGTGFSSLGQIQRMPVDRIKIDRSFINDIEQDKAARDIVRTIVDLCRNLGLECVVEGVETLEQLELLNRWAAAWCRATTTASRCPRKVPRNSSAVQSRSWRATRAEVSIAVAFPPSRIPVVTLGGVHPVACRPVAEMFLLPEGRARFQIVHQVFGGLQRRAPVACRRDDEHDRFARRQAPMPVNHGEPLQREPLFRLTGDPGDLVARHAGIVFQFERRQAPVLVAADAGKGDDSADVSPAGSQPRAFGAFIERLALNADGRHRACSSTGHRRKKRNFLGSGDRHVMGGVRAIDGGADDLRFLKRVCAGLVARGKPGDEVGDRVDFRRKRDFLLGLSDTLADPGEVEQFHASVSMMWRIPARM